MKIKITPNNTLYILAENDRDRLMIEEIEIKVRADGAPESLILDKLYEMRWYQRLYQWIKKHMAL